MGTTRIVGGRRSGLRKAACATIALIAAAALTACTGGGGSNNTPAESSSAPASGAAAGGGGDAGDFSIAFIVGASDYAFFSTMKRGAEDAAAAMKLNGGSLNWLPTANYNNFGPDLAKLLQTAIGTKPAAIAAIDPVPDAQTEIFKQITASGTPLVLVNSGGEEAAKDVGAINYVGSDNKAAGVAGGEYLGDKGVKKALCVNTFPGTSFATERCTGIEEGIKSKGGTSSELALPSSNFGNPTAIAQAIKAALQKDPSIDAIVTLDLASSDAGANALEQAGVADKVKFGTFDVNTAQTDRIKAGKQLFAIDQQPYMQGYLAVSLAYQYAKFGLRLPETAVLTGPALVTAENVDAAIAGAKAGAR